MTEGDKAFFKRRMREEIQQARNDSSPLAKRLHLSWALYFNARLDGKRLACPALGASA